MIQTCIWRDFDNEILCFVHNLRYFYNADLIFLIKFYNATEFVVAITLIIYSIYLLKTQAVRGDTQQHSVVRVMQVNGIYRVRICVA